MITLEVPNNIKLYTMIGEPKLKVSVDEEVVDEIKHLWSLGIRTTGCCSGHEIRDGYIGVIDEDINRMFVLGYEYCPNELDLNRMDSFYPKTKGEDIDDEN